MSISSPNRLGPSGKSVSFFVRAGPSAGAAARREISMRNGSLPDTVRDDVLLLLTELVTNAVRHGDVGPERTVRVEVERGPERVRVTVLDRGHGFEHVPARPHYGDRGWGLFLVGRVADRWGIRPAASGTSVWFEIGPW